MNDAENTSTQIVATSEESKQVMNLIAAAVADKSFDVVKLEKLMDLQERILNRNARQAFASDFVQMQPRLPKVVRTKKNTQTNSMYAPLEEINMAVGPILAEFGFGISSKVINQDETSVRVRAELWHRGGHIETNEITMPLDDCGIAGKVNKTKPHALSSSIMYARRNAEAALLNISTGEDKDGNNVIENRITTEQAVDIDVRLRAISEAYHRKFLEWLGVENANEIKASDYKRAIHNLSEREQQAAEKARKEKESNA